MTCHLRARRASLLTVLLLWLPSAMGWPRLLAADIAPTTVGMPRQLTQWVLPGSLLRPKPLERGQPVVIRIVAAYPHGDAVRYDMEYMLLEPGTFDLRDYLQRADGSALDDLPSLRVEATTALPVGQVLPNEIPPGPLPGWGGYRAVLIAVGILWGLGLLFLLVPRRKRRLEPADQVPTESLETRLREAIQAAQANTLTPAERAELERMVLAHWRQRLGLAHLPAAEALSELRRHEPARVALDLLEQWLHHPQGRNIQDFAALLDPVTEDLRAPRV